jgi:hypothetical protein
MIAEDDNGDRWHVVSLRLWDGLPDQVTLERVTKHQLYTAITFRRAFDPVKRKNAWMAVDTVSVQGWWQDNESFLFVPGIDHGFSVCDIIQRYQERLVEREILA